MVLYTISRSYFEISDNLNEYYKIINKNKTTGKNNNHKNIVCTQVLNLNCDPYSL